MIIVFFEKYVLVDPDINNERVTTVVKDWDMNNEQFSEISNINILRNINVSYPAFSSAIVFYSMVAY